jgi:hypothetical protein
MHVVIPQQDILLTQLAEFGTRATGVDVLIEFVDGDVVIAVLTVLGLGRTDAFMLCELLWRQLLLAILAGLLSVEVGIMLLHVVDVHHLAALLALFYVSAAVREVAIDLRLGKILSTVLAFLCCLHQIKNILVTS